MGWLGGGVGESPKIQISRVLGWMDQWIHGDHRPQKVGQYRASFKPIHGNCAIYFYPGVDPQTKAILIRIINLDRAK